MMHSIEKDCEVIFAYLEFLEEFKEETGLGEALEELKETERDLKKTIKEADPTEEIRQAGHEVESAVRDVEKSVKAEFKPEEKN